MVLNRYLYVHFIILIGFVYCKNKLFIFEKNKFLHFPLKHTNGWDTTHISCYLIGYKERIPMYNTQGFRAFLGDNFGWETSIEQFRKRRE